MDEKMHNTVLRNLFFTPHFFLSQTTMRHARDQTKSGINDIEGFYSVANLDNGGVFKGVKHEQIKAL